MKAASSGSCQPAAPFGHSKPMCPPCDKTTSATSMKCFRSFLDWTRFSSNFFRKRIPSLDKFTDCHFDHGPHGNDPHNLQPGNRLTSFLRDSISPGSDISDVVSLKRKWVVPLSSWIFPKVEFSEQQNSNITDLPFLTVFLAWEWLFGSTLEIIAMIDFRELPSKPSSKFSTTASPFRRPRLTFVLRTAAWIVALLASIGSVGKNHVFPTQLLDEILWFGFDCQLSLYTEVLLRQTHSVNLSWVICSAEKGQSPPTGANSFFRGLTWILHHAFLPSSNSQ